MFIVRGVCDVNYSSYVVCTCVYYLDKLDCLQGSYSRMCLSVLPHLAPHTCEHTAQALHGLKYLYV